MQCSTSQERWRRKQMYATKVVNIWAGRSTRGVIKIGACFQNTCCSDNTPPPVGPTGNICAYSQDIPHCCLMIWCVLLLIKTNTQIKQSLHCSSNHGSVMFGCYSFVLKIATELWAPWLPATNGSVSTLMETTILWVLSYSEVGLTAILWCIFVV